MIVPENHALLPKAYSTGHLHRKAETLL